MTDFICELPKNTHEAIRFRLEELKGHRFIDMWIFVAEPVDNGGKPKEPALTGQEGGEQRKM